MKIVVSERCAVPRKHHQVLTFMGGVDLADQNCSYYDLGSYVKKFWKCLMWYMLNTYVVNSFVIYKECWQPVNDHSAT